MTPLRVKQKDLDGQLCPGETLPSNSRPLMEDANKRISSHQLPDGFPSLEESSITLSTDTTFIRRHPFKSTHSQLSRRRHPGLLPRPVSAHCPQLAPLLLASILFLVHVLASEGASTTDRKKTGKSLTRLLFTIKVDTRDDHSVLVL